MGFKIVSFLDIQISNRNLFDTFIKPLDTASSNFSLCWLVQTMTRKKLKFKKKKHGRTQEIPLQSTKNTENGENMTDKHVNQQRPI